MRYARVIMFGILVVLLSAGSARAAGCTNPETHAEVCACGFTQAVNYCTYHQNDPDCRNHAQLQYDLCIIEEWTTPITRSVKGALKSPQLNSDLDESVVVVAPILPAIAPAPHTPKSQK